jgi:hypothetical protein
MGFWSNIFGKGGSYFLDDESAKGMGDTEYMKQSKTVRRTFPGSVDQEEFEMVKQVSAMNASTFDGRESGGARPPSAPSYQPGSSSTFGGASSSASSFGPAAPRCEGEYGHGYVPQPGQESGPLIQRCE